MPTWVEERRRILDPSYNHHSDIESWMQPLFEWRLLVGKAFRQDIINLQKLFIYPESFPVLRHFFIRLDRRPPADLNPAPASFPFEDSEIEALRDRIAKERGFVVTKEERDGEYNFLEMEKKRSGEEDDAMEERGTTPGPPQLTWSTVAMAG